MKPLPYFLQAALYPLLPGSLACVKYFFAGLQNIDAVLDFCMDQLRDIVGGPLNLFHIFFQNRAVNLIKVNDKQADHNNDGKNNGCCNDYQRLASRTHA